MLMKLAPVVDVLKLFSLSLMLRQNKLERWSLVIFTG
jgi:hypothetical protein